MEKYHWIKDIVFNEEEMEKQGLVDFSPNSETSTNLEQKSIEFLMRLNHSFREASATYNSFKGSETDKVKIYGVSKTRADFMLFRHGFKLIFSLKKPGTIQIYSSQLPASFMPQASADNPHPQVSIRHLIVARVGAFEELYWTFKDQKINIEHLVRYYFTMFTKYSNNN